MKKEIVFDCLFECPVPGCKRGLYTEYFSCERHYCPEHHREMLAVFKDEKGYKYVQVDNFGESRA